MKILLHMGQGKTGTTALQGSLWTASAKLRAKQVLYPRFGLGSTAHHALRVLCGNPLGLSPWNIERLGGPEMAVQKVQAAWKKTCDDIRSSPPQVLVLSTEHLATVPNDAAEKVVLARLLKDLSDDITPIFYVRHPVDHFRASAQQWLKHRSGPMPFHRMPLRDVILDAESKFSRRPELVAFDRATLHGGDIVQDFATRFLSPWVGPADLPSVQANVGLSAEALVLMGRLRAEAGNTPDAHRDVARLIPFLEAFDLNHPSAQRFTLLPEVADAALRGATSHRWLAETGKLQIPGLDISKIDGAAAPDWMTTAPAETLFLHDPDRLDHLRQSLERAGSKAYRRPVSARKSGKPLKRFHDFLLRFLRSNLASADDRNTGATPTQSNTDGR